MNIEVRWDACRDQWSCEMPVKPLKTGLNSTETCDTHICWECSVASGETVSNCLPREGRGSGEGVPLVEQHRGLRGIAISDDSDGHLSDSPRRVGPELSVRAVIVDPCFFGTGGFET